MIFSLRDFIMTGLLSAIGDMEDYKIMLNAAGWHDKGVLEIEDLAKLEQVIAAKAKAEAEEAIADDAATEG